MRISDGVQTCALPIYAGVALGGLTMDEIFSPMPIGIAAGLFIGKQLGIFSAVWLAVKTGFAARPRGATWLQIYAVAVICGIGFTMSLFIGGLAFSDPLLIEEAKDRKSTRLNSSPSCAT